MKKASKYQSKKLVGLPRKEKEYPVNVFMKKGESRKINRLIDRQDRLEVKRYNEDIAKVPKKRTPAKVSKLTGKINKKQKKLDILMKPYQDEPETIFNTKSIRRT